MSAIEVERDAGSAAARSATCKVTIDSLDRGVVSHGQKLCIDMEPGIHTVRIAVDGEECPPVKVVVGLGTTTLRCLTRQRRALGIFALSAAKTSIVVMEEREPAGRDMIGPGERFTVAGSVPMPKAYLRANRAHRVGPDLAA